MKEYILETSYLALLPFYINTFTFGLLTITTFTNYKTAIILNMDINLLQKVMMIVCSALFVIYLLFSVYSFVIKIIN